MSKFDRYLYREKTQVAYTIFHREQLLNQVNLLQLTTINLISYLKPIPLSEF